MPIFERIIGKPSPGSLFNPASELAAGLRVFVPIWETSGLTAQDAVSGLNFGVVGSPTWSSGQYGSSILMTASSAGMATGTIPVGLQLPYPMSVAMRCRWTGTNPSSNNHLCRVNSATSSGPLQIRYNGSTAALSVSSSAGTVSTGYTMVSKAWTSLVLSLTNAGKAFYVNGSLIYSDATAATNSSYTTAQSFLSFGWDSTATAGAAQLEVDYFGLWNRELLAQDALALHANPWQIFAPTTRISVLFSASAGVSASGGITLGALTVAGSGAFSTSASSAISLGALTVSASGTFKATATGSVALAALTAAGSGSFSTTASGSIALAGLNAAGSQNSAATGAGSIALAAMAVSGTGGFTATGSGSIVLSASSATGSASAGPGSGYAGADVLEALQNWWLANGSSYSSDGALWHLEAPETTGLPYVTYYLVSEDCEDNTTGFQAYRSSVQFNAHAATGAAAWALAKALRQAIKGAPLIVGGNAVWHVLPDSMVAPQVGEGRGPDDSDCWIAGAVFDIPWNT